jgi:DNA-binding transcriptional MerR regulator
MVEMPPLPDKEYYSIGEVSSIVKVPAYVLRFWETEFSVIRPERHSGQRKYQKKDIEMICQVKDLLYTRKFTIPGARKHLKAERLSQEEGVQLNAEFSAPQPVPVDTIREIRQELEDLLNYLR